MIDSGISRSSSFGNFNFLYIVLETTLRHTDCLYLEALQHTPLVLNPIDFQMDALFIAIGRRLYLLPKYLISQASLCNQNSFNGVRLVMHEIILLTLFQLFLVPYTVMLSYLSRV
jgi:hypothetical protein